MSGSDPIADMLTRIRNAHMAGLDTVEMSHSRLKGDLTRVLKREGYITDYVVEGAQKKTLRIYLKYSQDHQPAINGIKRESTSGLRKYARAETMPKVLGGMGVVILSTSKGIMTDKEAIRQRLGGEILCTVW